MTKKNILLGAQLFLLLLLFLSVYSFIWVEDSTISGDTGMLMEIYQEIHNVGINILIMLGVIWIEIIKKK